MNKIEKAKKKAMEEAIAKFETMTQEEANNYISENYMITQLTKALMAAYIKKYATSDEEMKWRTEVFKKASTKIAKRKVQTVCTGANGVAIHKLGKNGKSIPKTIRVDSITGETYETFDLSGARKAFVEHFNIIPKANKFKAKEKRETPIFDEFADLF